MATKARNTKFRYIIELTYLDQKKNKATAIKNECVKFVIIDHNYEKNCMPIVYVNLRLDKKFMDDMIKNCNNNLIMMVIYKYDDLTDEKQKIECLRKKFTYFLPNDVNKNDTIDYTEETESEHLNNTFRQAVIGLMCIDHINLNKQTFKFNLKKVSISEPVNTVMGNFDNLIMEKIGDPTKIESLVVPAKDSVNSMLRELNNIRVFYDTPYRYYQDFNHTYLISSSGRAIKKPGDTYTSILVNIEEINKVEAYEIGAIINKTSKTYEVPMNYVNVSIYDNTLSNKSRTTLVGMSSSGATDKSLKNTASYSKDKKQTIRLNNDNEGMLDNIKAIEDSSNFFVYIQKVDLDTDLFTLNKRVTIHFIDRYREHDGDFLMYRKREMYLREDDTFLMNSMIDFKELQK